MHLEYSLCGNHMIPHDLINQGKNYGTLQIDDEIAGHPPARYTIMKHAIRTVIG